MPASRPFLCLFMLATLATPLTGCLSPLHRQASTVASATTPVIEQATAAYHDANNLYNLSVDYQAVAAFAKVDPVYNPRKATLVLLPERDIQIRLKVLQAFQAYVASIVDITNGTGSPELDSASQSIGANLTGISNDVAPAIESKFAVSGAPANPLTPTMRNGVSVAANALGQFLVHRAIAKDLPNIIIKMDPNVKALCELLESDVDLLKDQQTREFDSIMDAQRLFLLTSPTLNPEDRRNEIMKLPGIVRQERQADERLTALRSSIVRFYLTHHALAGQVQGNNPKTLKGKLADLQTAGSNLGTFYSSLPTN
jgi:hypothetical protein